jgi:hypothetical protein
MATRWRTWAALWAPRRARPKADHAIARGPRHLNGRTTGLQVTCCYVSQVGTEPAHADDDWQKAI